MTISDKGRAFIESNEDCVLHTYFDEDDPPVLSLGIGHVCKPSEPWWNGGRPSIVPVITRAQADAMFVDELRLYEACVASCVDVPLTDDQHTALVDFAYNEGCSALAHSTLVRILNTGDYAGAAAHFAEWNKVPQAGKLVVSANLAARRERERLLFLAGTTLPVT